MMQCERQRSLDGFLLVAIASLVGCVGDLPDSSETMRFDDAIVTTSLTPDGLHTELFDTDEAMTLLAVMDVSGDTGTVAFNG